MSWPGALCCVLGKGSNLERSLRSRGYFLEVKRGDPGSKVGELMQKVTANCVEIASKAAAVE